MRPIEFPETNCVYGKDQEGVEPLPVCKFDTGEVLSCWVLSPRRDRESASDGLYMAYSADFQYAVAACVYDRE